MNKCEVCGNEYEATFDVVIGGERHTFDCFECAIAALAPVCGHCGVRIIGHGVEAWQRTFCCASCAEKAGVHGLRDHVREVVALTGPR